MFAVTELDPKLSGLIWTAMFGSLALVTMVGVNPFAIRTFFISTIFRFIFSVGLEYTLWLLGAFNVSTIDIIPIFKAERDFFFLPNLNKFRIVASILRCYIMQHNDKTGFGFFCTGDK